MPLDLGDLNLSGISDALKPGSSTSQSQYGPARTRVGRWAIRTYLATSVIVLIAMLAAWLCAASPTQFNELGRLIAGLAVVVLLVLFVLHFVAVIVANLVDKRAETSER